MRQRASSVPAVLHAPRLTPPPRDLSEPWPFLTPARHGVAPASFGIIAHLPHPCPPGPLSLRLPPSPQPPLSRAALLQPQLSYCLQVSRPLPRALSSQVSGLLTTQLLNPHKALLPEVPLHAHSSGKLLFTLQCPRQYYPNLMGQREHGRGEHQPGTTMDDLGSWAFSH